MPGWTRFRNGSGKNRLIRKFKIRGLDMFGFSVADWIFIVLVIAVIFFFVALSGMNKRKN